MSPTTEHTMPTTKPTMTCNRECWRKIIRLVPRMPARISTTQSHHTGLKPKNSPKTKSAPATPPMAAVWVEIFHHTLMRAQTTWMNNAA